MGENHLLGIDEEYNPKARGQMEGAKGMIGLPRTNGIRVASLSVSLSLLSR